MRGDKNKSNDCNRPKRKYRSRKEEFWTVIYDPGPCGFRRGAQLTAVKQTTRLGYFNPGMVLAKGLLPYVVIQDLSDEFEALALIKISIGDLKLMKRKFSDMIVVRDVRGNRRIAKDSAEGICIHGIAFIDYCVECDVNVVEIDEEEDEEVV